MRGAIAVSAPLDGLTILRGADALTLYRFNTGTAAHHFCRHCGIYTHHRRRSNPNQLGVNVACLDGIRPFDFAEVAVTDGQNHESDGGGGGVAGMLRYAGAGQGRLTRAAVLRKRRLSGFHGRPAAALRRRDPWRSRRRSRSV
jgi:hypothetical protein